MQKPPYISLKILSNNPAEGRDFIKKEVHKCEINYPGIYKTRIMTLESIVRRSQDAAVIIAYEKTENGIKTWLRSSFRTAAYIRSLKEPDYEYDGNLWEFPAGLIDHGEKPIEAAKREFREEIGFDIDINRFVHLQTVLPMPSLIAERLYFYSVEILPDDIRHEPSLDGSPLEDGGEVILASLNELYNELKDISDIKTNLGVRMLKDIAEVKNV